MSQRNQMKMMLNSIIGCGVSKRTVFCILTKKTTGMELLILMELFLALILSIRQF